MNAFFTSKKNIFIALVVVGLLLISAGGVWGYQKYELIRLQKEVDVLHTLLQSPELSRDVCSQIMTFDTQKAEKEGIVFQKDLFQTKLSLCDSQYNILKAELSYDFCQQVMLGRAKDFKTRFLLLDGFSEVQKNCSMKFLSATFATGTLFDSENDFKSSVTLTFGLPFYQDLDEENDNEAFLAHRIEAKKRLIELLQITPKQDITVDDIVLYPERAIVTLPLDPESKTTFALKQYDSSIQGEVMKTEPFTLVLSKFQYFGLRIQEKMTLFQDTRTPHLELQSYNTQKTGAKIKICRIPNESYAKVETLKEQTGLSDIRKQFFKSGVDALASYDCKEKQVDFDVVTTLLKKKSFDFKDLLGDPARSGLYVVTFANAGDRENFGKIQDAIFFGIVDSHITMKVSKNGEAFFFVNDFAGKPLAGQTIRVFANDFIAKNTSYNEKGEANISYNSPLENSIFGKEIVLGKTAADGTLQVNMKTALGDIFEKTFESWNYDWDGNYNGFFVSASSDTNLTYVSSQWNGGISGWNFGYTLGDGWWYGNSENMDEISLERWQEEEPELYSHVFSERKLYLPGESVYLKGILRNSKDLSLPVGKVLKLSITNPQGTEVLQQDVKISEYGSFSHMLDLGADASLGNYFVSLMLGERQIGGTSFSVEVFKNPKFKNEVMLQTQGLNGELLQNITQEKIISDEYAWSYEQINYKADFSIQASVSSKYYSGSPVKNAGFDYKVYRQYYYDMSYWDNCYYGCYWEREKEFYSEGSGTLDADGRANFNIPVSFVSSYDDYKYIVEVTVKDTTGESISGSNAIIARLPVSYKTWNPQSGIVFEAEKRFYEQGKNVKITGRLDNGVFTKDYFDDFLFIIKKKDYTTNYVSDVRGYQRPITRFHETVEKVLQVNDTNFSLTRDGVLTLNYPLQKTGEYVIEFGKKQKLETIDGEVELDPTTKKYFTLIAYGDEEASNPIESDNKITVLSEKISYKPGETARVLVRLPFSNGKILWTIEKQGVIKHEYIYVPGNTFFKEFVVDDTFIPNAYIGILAVDTDGKNIPEYKVGYTEIVVDKTEKKTDIALKTNKTVYEPREEVTLDIDTKRASEVTVMVVDESLISLMGNIDTNLLEKFYKKLPFQIQTSIGNIAMLKNYYFSRQGIVGGSGFGNFKGGDSAVSSRNIFKNTAYYNASIITSASGKAQVKFTLPDNLTNFRIMALSHSKDNFFGYSETSLEVRKDVIVEDRTPLILREADEVVLGANIFNMTDKEIGFSSTLTIDGAKLLDPSEKKSMIPAGGSEFVTWKVQQTKNCPILSKDCTLPYTISVLGDSVDHSDKISGNIAVKYIPTLIQNVQNSQVFTTGQSKDMTLTLPENTNIEKSFYEFSVSNTPLAGIEDIVKSLAVYPYGCGEQLLSSTLPNAILLKFSTLLGDVGVSQAEIQKNLDYGLSEIYKMQLPSGAMKYWQGDSEGNTSITAYGLRVLLEIQAAGKTVDTKVITSLKTYLEKTYPTATGSEKLEILSSLARLHGKDTSSILKITDLTQGNDIAALNRHELLLLTQALSLADAVKYKAKITEFLALIDAKMISDTQSYWYDDILSDRALQIQILLTLKSDEASIAQKIQSLAARDWQSYWFSTKAKNMSFLAFARYIEIYGNTKQNTVKLTMNGKVSELSIGANGKKVHSISVPLSEVLQENKVALQVQNISGGALFVDATIRSYPQDPLKVKSYSNNIQIKRSIYEVVDETKLTPECTWSETGSYSCTEPGGVVLHTGENFKKSTKYKIVLEATFSEQEERRNLTIEDYLPAGFKVLNQSFKTNEIATSQATTQDTWSWSHAEKRPELVMVHASYVWDKVARYEYFVSADFAGTFLYPPAVAYLMYEPQVRANTGFERVVIK